MKDNFYEISKKMTNPCDHRAKVRLKNTDNRKTYCEKTSLDLNMPGALSPTAPFFILDAK